MDNKILFMLQFFYPEYITSALLPFQTAEHLVKEGFDVTVYCGYPKEYVSDEKNSVPKKETVSGIKINRIKYMQFERSNMLLRIINYFSLVVSFLLKTFSFRKYDQIVVYSNPPILPIVAIVCNMLFKTDIIFVSYDIYPEIALKTDNLDENSITTKFMNFINKQLYKRAKKVVALSTEMKEFILENWDIDEEKVVVIPNWATEEDKNTSVNKNKSEQTSDFCITYLGNMGIPQDMETLLQSIKILNETDHNIKFSFAGHGNKKEKIAEIKSKYELTNLQVYGFLKGNELESLINNTDAFILSLKDELNGLAVPSKFYTYLYSRKPIIAVLNQNSDIAEDIKKYSLGISVENENSEKLAQKIIQLSQEENNIISGDVYKNKFSKNAQLDKYAQLFARLNSEEHEEGYADV